MTEHQSEAEAIPCRVGYAHHLYIHIHKITAIQCHACAFLIYNFSLLLSHSTIPGASGRENKLE